MKTTFKSLAILMMAAVGFAACGDDDNNDNGNLKEYALQVRLNLIPNDSSVAPLLEKTVETALASLGLLPSQPNGLTPSQSYLYLAARDSADAAPKVQEIGKKLEAVLDKNAGQMYGNVCLMAVEKQQLESSDSKQRRWSCWYELNYPEAENHNLSSYWGYPSNEYYVYNLEILNSGSNVPADRQFNVDDPNGDCYEYVDPIDLNERAGGSYLYLKMTGVSKVSHPEYGKHLITDVVMLTTSGANYPKSVEITKDGQKRRYYPVFTADKGANGSTKHDLNDGIFSSYLWMYYTTDYYDGWVLKNNMAWDFGESCDWVTCVMYKKPYSQEEPRRRYMHIYEKNSDGEWIDGGIADMNKGTIFWSTDLFLSMVFEKVL